MVFAKSYCPYCKATKELLSRFEESLRVQVHAIDLDLMDQEDGALIQMELLKQTGQRTVPNSECHVKLNRFTFRLDVSILFAASLY